MDSQTGGIFVIVLLLAINAFFVAAEFALVKAKMFRIDLIADGGSRAAKLTQRIQINLESYLAACQLGITMASLGLGWVGEPVVAALLEPVFNAFGLSDNAVHTTSFIIGFLIFSSLHIVVGEQVPKTFAIRKAEPVSLWCAYPLHFFYLLVFPLNWLLNKASGSILAMFNVEEATHADVLSNDEIRGIIVTSEQHGELETDRATMLHNMFKFDSHEVQQIMVPRTKVEVLNLHGSWEQILEIIKSSQHSRFPVFDGNAESPVGVVLVKDIYNNIVGQELTAKPADILSGCLREAPLVPESQQVSKLFEIMRLDRTHLAMVFDEYGSFSGIVTMEDMLEEIVGEISDELDLDDPDTVAPWVDDHWETDGMVSISDLSRSLGMNFSDLVNVNTVNGLFMRHLDRMPTKGDQFVYQGLRFVAIDETGNRIGKVSIYKSDLDDADFEQKS